MLISSTVAILLTWVAIAIILTGVGSLVLRLFSSDFLLVDAFWSGLGVSVAILEIWSLARPVNSTIIVLLCCIGALGVIANRRPLFHHIRNRSCRARPLAPVYLVVATFLAFRASGPCEHYDTGLYGAQAVRWILTYPAVHGLANVHGRLGFNSSVFLCIAGLSQGVWNGLGFHLFTGFLSTAICFTLLPACRRLISKSSTCPADWFYAILAIPMSFLAARGVIVGTQTDEPATIVCLVATGILFEQLHRNDAEVDWRLGQTRLVAATVLFALAVTFKESTVVFALLAWCLAFGRILAGAQPLRNQMPYILGAIVLSISIVMPWGARGIVSSGYPFFPATVLSLRVHWGVPIPVATWYAAGVKSWGRMPDVAGANTSGLAWLRPWLSQSIRNRVGFQVPMLISLGGLLAVLGFRFRRRTSSVYPWIWLLIPSLAGTVFWFIAAPALRFGQFAIWTAAGTFGAWGIACATAQGIRWIEPSKAALLSLLALMIWCLVSFGWKVPYERLLAVRGLAPLPKAMVTPRPTLSGLTVYVPDEGNQCWDAPLPCTPYFDETLRLRNTSSERFEFISGSLGRQLPSL